MEREGSSGEGSEARGRGAHKAAKVAAEVEWKAIVTAHERALKEWVDECEMLRAQNVRVRDLPQKPKPVVEAVGDEDEDENDEDERLGMCIPTGVQSAGF